MAAANVDLPVKDDVHVAGGFALAEDERAVNAHALGAVVDEPDVFVLGEAVEEGDGAEGGVDLFAA